MLKSVDEQPLSVDLGHVFRDPRPRFRLRLLRNVLPLVFMLVNHGGLMRVTLIRRCDSFPLSSQAIRNQRILGHYNACVAEKISTPFIHHCSPDIAP